MTALALGEQIWVNYLDRPVGEARESAFRPDVSLVLEQPQQTSIRNILPAQVVQCLETTDRLKCS
jgi:molybdate transport system ATP-binding protein